MALAIPRGPSVKARLLTTLIAAFVLVAQPFYTLIASQVANATPGLTYTSVPFVESEWVGDRTFPTGGIDVTGGDNNLEVKFRPNQSSLNPHHKTEGVKRSLPENISVKSSIYLYSGTAAIEGYRAGFWATATNGSATEWPVIEFANKPAGDESYTGWRVWNAFSDSWINIPAASVATGTAIPVEITYDSSTDRFNFYIDGSLRHSYAAQDGYNAFDGVIYNVYNPGDPSDSAAYPTQYRNLAYAVAPAPAPEIQMTRFSTYNEEQPSMGIAFQFDFNGFDNASGVDIYIERENGDRVIKSLKSDKVAGLVNGKDSTISGRIYTKEMPGQTEDSSSSWERVRYITSSGVDNTKNVLWTENTRPTVAYVVISSDDNQVSHASDAIPFTETYHGTTPYVGVLPNTPAITSIDAYYNQKTGVAGKSWKGIGVDFRTQYINAATELELRINRAGGATYSAFAKQSVLDAINGEAAKQTPSLRSGVIAIQLGDYVGSWNQSSTPWTGAALPESVDVIITLDDGSKIELRDTTIGSNLATWDQVKPEIPVDTAKPVMTDYKLSNYSLRSGGDNPTLAGSTTDDIGVTSVKYAIFKYVDGKRTSVRSWKDLPAAGGTNYGDTMIETDSIMSLKSLPEGIYEFSVRAWDAAGNKTNGGDMVFYVDNTAPTFSLTDDGSPRKSIADGAVVNPAKLGGKEVRFAKESLTDVLYVNGAKINASGYVGHKSGKIGWKFASEGTYTIFTRDEAGNQSESITITIDRTAPTASIDLDSSVNPTIAQIIADDTNLNRIDVSLWKNSNTTQVAIKGEWYSSPSFSKDYAPLLNFASLPDGEYTIRATANDKAWNGTNAVNVNFTVDRTNPTVSATMSSTTLTAGDMATVTINANDATSGIDYVQYRILDAGKNNISGLGWVTIPNKTPTDISAIGGLAPGSYVLRARAFDSAGNKKSGADVTFTIEQATPLLTADYFTVHADHIAVGFGIDRFDDATRVEVELFDAGDNSITKNVGSSVDMVGLLNSHTGEISSPFYIPSQPDDSYWTFGTADWASVLPAYAVVTVFYGTGEELSDRVDFVSANVDMPSLTYAALIANLPSDDDEDGEEENEIDNGGEPITSSQSNDGAAPFTNPLFGFAFQPFTNNDETTQNANENETDDNDSNVLGEQNQEGTPLSDTGEVLGIMDHKFFGLAWYWYLVILAAIVGAWLLLAAAIRRNREDEA